jgi:hypothetical protein
VPVLRQVVLLLANSLSLRYFAFFRHMLCQTSASDRRPDEATDDPENLIWVTKLMARGTANGRENTDSRGQLPFR